MGQGAFMTASDHGLLAWILVRCAGALLTLSVQAAAAATGAVSTSSTLNLSVTTHSFADQQATTPSQPKTVTVTNVGTTAVTMKSIALIGNEADDFSQSNNCGSSIATHASCSIKVVFKPVSAGAKFAALSVTDSAARSPQSVVLKGTGIVPMLGSARPS
jgi:hypothetical protein